MQTFATRAVAERTGVGEASLRDLATRLALASTSNLDPELLRALQALGTERTVHHKKVTRLECRSMEGPVAEPTLAAEAVAVSGGIVDAEAVAERVTAALRADHALAEKYALASHRLGELEADLRHERAHARQLHTANDELQRRIGQLLAELQAERLTPWWRRLFR